MDGVVVIGEGEKDEAPMLYNGEHIGDGSAAEVDIAVDPLEGTTLTAKGMPSALTRDRAVAPRHDVRPGPVRLHEEARRRARAIADLLDLDRPLAETIGLVAERKQKPDPRRRSSSSSTARATRTASRRSARPARACG